MKLHNFSKSSADCKITITNQLLLIYSKGLGEIRAVPSRRTWDTI